MLTMQQAADQLGLFLSTVRRRTHSGEIPAYNMGGDKPESWRWRYDEAELRQYMDARRNRKGAQGASS
jgi:excisionase family DNA binding protein